MIQVKKKKKKQLKLKKEQINWQVVKYNNITWE